MPIRTYITDRREQHFNEVRRLIPSEIPPIGEHLEKPFQVKITSNKHLEIEPSVCFQFCEDRLSI